MLGQRGIRPFFDLVAERVELFRANRWRTTGDRFRFQIALARAQLQVPFDGALADAKDARRLGGAHATLDCLDDPLSQIYRVCFHHCQDLQTNGNENIFGHAGIARPDSPGTDRACRPSRR